jgi:aldehyde dehydrogenase (NAD+)
MSPDPERSTAGPSQGSGTDGALQSRYELFIHGEPREPRTASYFSTCDPANGELLTKVARGDANDVDTAVRDAEEAFPAWRDQHPAVRGRILTAIAAALRGRSAELARMETLDNGKPLHQSVADVEIAARYFEFYSGLADKILGETIPLGPNYHAYTRREPFGVTAHIVPWNAPIQQAARGIAPALAAGNTVVAKPSQLTPLTCLALARIGAECGLAPGVFNVVTGTGGEAGTALVSHPSVRKIAFTGSVETGRSIMRAAADRLVPLTLELGGKSPNIVFEDADLDRAARSSIIGYTLNTGQACSAGTRLLVQRRVHDEFVERLVTLTKGLKIGPGMEDPDVGPLTSAEQRDRVFRYIKVGAAEGARPAVGGSHPMGGRLASGYFVEPTILVNTTNLMRVAREEIFGPVLCVIPFESESEAIEIANDSDFGLVAGLWTQDLGRAHRVAARLEVGQVYVNEYFAGGVETPFGGWKQSGFGREKGVEAVHHYTELKTVVVRVQ